MKGKNKTITKNPDDGYGDWNRCRKTDSRKELEWTEGVVWKMEQGTRKQNRQR